MIVVKVINTRDNTFPHNYFITKTNLVFITVLEVTTGLVIIRVKKIFREASHISSTLLFHGPGSHSYNDITILLTALNLVL